MLAFAPTGVIIFPGSGITGNLADTAKKLRIPVLDHREARNSAALFYHLQQVGLGIAPRLNKFGEAAFACLILALT